MKILQVVGYKNTGKTTLITDLVHLIKANDKTVAVIKNHHLEEKVDDSTDTGKFFEAGSDYTVLTTPGHVMLLENRQVTLTRLLERFQNEAVDFVLVEGFKQENYSKILLTFSFDDGETDINQIGLKNVLNYFDMRYDNKRALEWFKEWGNL
ncbi:MULTISPECIES: molybdopterin-guanine dinucleotide biosynthesis protein B [Jeotgalicoccus]|uniref:molybdopterin-guanine dinucleotide biosynthesis protein B n=1 Tax=Jeotgalicoccus TaxID=227979 RepID=UPI000420A08A|nr:MULTISPECIES: molybdopterin-guanine dinucleotide biosynthesis protein B [Jeotgalicoccus]